MRATRHRREVALAGVAAATVTLLESKTQSKYREQGKLTRCQTVRPVASSAALILRNPTDAAFMMTMGVDIRLLKLLLPPFREYWNTTPVRLCCSPPRPADVRTTRAHVLSPRVLCCRLTHFLLRARAPPTAQAADAHTCHGLVSSTQPYALQDDCVQAWSGVRVNPVEHLALLVLGPTLLGPRAG